MSNPGNPLRFALRRLILIDSYTEGRISELPIAGGTAITGRNGRGKTSLLQLIPAFYGERPDRIVRPVSNKKNFARYYLPRATSYIIYEYHHDGEARCAVLFADDSGEGINYRFFRSGYHQDLFVLEDEQTIVLSGGLPERMKLKGVSLSRKMALDEYRAIIQGKVSHGSDRAWQRQMIREYAFCPANQSLPHIERIVAGMFMRKTNFTDLQRMVVASITEAGNQIALGAERRKIEVWPDSYDSYTMVMSEEHRMPHVQTAYDAILAAEHELRVVHARLVLLDGHVERQEVAARAENESEKLALTTAQDKYDEAVRAFQQRIEASTHKTNLLDGELRHIMLKHVEFDGAGVKAKADLLALESQILLTKQQCDTRRRLLLEKQANISGQYEKLLGELALADSERQRNFAERKASARDIHDEKKRHLDEERERRLDVLQQEAGPDLDELQAGVDRALMSVGEARTHVTNPMPEPSLVEALERQSQATRDARAKQMMTSEADQAARQALALAKKVYGEAEHTLTTLQREEERLTDKLKNLRLHASPGEGSLLYLLRTQRPDWTTDIAKVLREDLLLRTDLAPAVSVHRQGVYGLDLDLDQLQAPIAADEDNLQLEITVCQEAWTAVRGRSASQNTVLRQANTLREQADTDAALKGGLAQTAKTAVASAEATENAARNAVKASTDSARTRAQTALTDAEAEHRGAAKQLTMRKDRLKREALEIRERSSRAVLEANAQLQAELEAIKRDEVRSKAQYDTDRQRIEEERTGRLKEAGVDTDALRVIETQLNQAIAWLRTIDESRTQVAEWKLWRDQHWERKPTIQASLDQEHTTLEQLTRDKAALVGTWEKDAEKRKVSIRRSAQRLDGLGKERIAIEARRKHLDGFPPDADTLVQQYDPSWTMLALIDQANRQYRAMHNEESRLTEHIQALKSAFFARRGSPPDQYYDTKRQEIGADRAERALEWVPIFKAWYESEYKGYRTLLYVEARTIAEAVADFHGQMNTFHTHVLRFNRQLQESLNANLGFESIGSVTVEIVSTIRDLEYWGTIEKVSDSRLTWGNDQALPPPEFAASLRELLGHWQLKESIRAELTNLIRIQGEVIENGTRRPFRKAEDLETISSHGLSYIVLVLIFIGFINRVRGKAAVNVTWALDEIKDLDVGNVELLMDILSRNNITLLSACPDPDPDVLDLFKNRCSIRADRCIYDTSMARAQSEGIHEDEEEAALV